MQFITHYTERYSYLDAARMALEGGCRWVQLRMKDTPVETIEPVALEVQALCRQYGATFIIDDHVELARKLHADGVHLGKKDMPIADARRILGAEYIIGGTANTVEDVLQHYKAGADRVELYTEPYATAYPKGREAAVAPFVEAAKVARSLGLGLNAGHDLSLVNLNYFYQNIPWLDEVSIGHALISDALYLGLERTVKEYKNCLR